jgi:hypothetical protein
MDPADVARIQQAQKDARAAKKDGKVAAADKAADKVSMRGVLCCTRQGCPACSGRQLLGLTDCAARCTWLSRAMCLQAAASAKKADAKAAKAAEK